MLGESRRRRWGRLKAHSNCMRISPARSYDDGIALGARATQHFASVIAEIPSYEPIMVDLALSKDRLKLQVGRRCRFIEAV